MLCQAKPASRPVPTVGSTSALQASEFPDVPRTALILETLKSEFEDACTATEKLATAGKYSDKDLLNEALQPVVSKDESVETKDAVGRDGECRPSLHTEATKRVQMQERKGVGTLDERSRIKQEAEMGTSRRRQRSRGSFSISL